MGAMTVTALIGVAVLALCGNAAAFFVSSPAPSIRTARSNVVKTQQALPLSHGTAAVGAAVSWQGKTADFQMPRGGALVLHASEEPSVDDLVAAAKTRPPVDFVAIAK